MKEKKLDIRADIFYNTTAVPKSKLFRSLNVFEQKKLTRFKKEDEKIRELHPSLNLKPQTAEENEKEINYTNIKTRLLNFQQRGVKWMRTQELDINKGGILADEMGLGKTIQTLSLIMSFSEMGSVNLIIAPVVAINQWLEEIQKHFNTENINAFILNIKLQKMSNKEININELIDKTKINILICSFMKVESSYRNFKKIKKSQNIINNYEVLFNLEYERVIIDEAHTIKNFKSSTAQSISEIRSNYKWLLTGTPVQNRIGDLYSLTRFLRLNPLSYYFCKKCDCSCFYWLQHVPLSVQKFNKFKNNPEKEIPENKPKNGIDNSDVEILKAEDEPKTVRRGFCKCGHFSTQHFSYFQRYINNFVKNFGFTELSSEVFGELAKIKDSLVLRRTKKSVEKEIGLPSKIVSVKRIYFTDEEKKFYNNLSKYAERYVKAFVKTRDNDNYKYINVLGLIQKMRLAVNHPILVTKQYTSPQIVCGYCQEEADDPIKAGCGHYFCRQEIKNYITENDKCPVCKTKLSIDLNSELELEKAKMPKININLNNWHSSTKLESIIMEISKITNDSFKNFVPKILIFSQFVSFLDLLDWRLKRAGFRCVKIAGGVPLSQRKAAIEEFNSNNDVNIFLISLQAGGLALNLVEATHVIITDLWWNPSVEDQAMDRIHRIGQKRPIRIIKMVVQDSIESKILELQKKKKALFDSAINNDNTALNSLGEEDLMFLFN